MKRKIVVRALVLICTATAPLLAGVAQTPPAPSTASQITEVTLQRTWCYGRCPIDEVVLSSDGTAKYTGKGNTARTGHYKGAFWKDDFEKLAQWLEAQGFFKLKSKYGSPNPDAPNQIISVVKGGQRKTVINHFSAPLELWGMERIVRGVASDIAWQAESSGIRGVVTWRPKTSSEFPELPAFRALPRQIIIVRPADDKQGFTLRTDDNGRFEISLRPGTYTIELPTFGRNPQTVNPQQTAVVQPDKFSDVAIKIDTLSEQTTP